MRPVRYPHCQKVLPAVYDDSLSYYESICKLVHKINELIEWTNQFDVDTITQEVLDTVRGELKDTIDELYTYIDNGDNALNEKITQVYKTIDTKYDELDNKYTDITNGLSKELSDLTDTVYNLNTEVYAYINQEVERLKDFISKYACDNIKCYNPVNGKYDSICNVLSSLYGALRYCGITANEFDDLGLTCNQFEHYNLSASEFDLYAGMKLYKNSLFYMFDPISGEYTFYQNVIETLWNLHRDNPITASAYDALQLTAQTFDSKSLTAYNFDNSAGTLLTA